MTDHHRPSQQSIEAVQASFIRAFATLTEPMTRYAYLVGLAKSLPTFPETDRCDAHLVTGCQSRTWLVDRSDADVFRFHAFSDATLVSGMLAILYQTYDGRHHDALLAHPAVAFLHTLGLSAELTPGRQTGLRYVAQRIDEFSRIAAG